MTDPAIEALAEAMGKMPGVLRFLGPPSQANLREATELLSHLRACGFKVVPDESIETEPQEMKGSAVQAMEDARDDT